MTRQNPVDGLENDLAPQSRRNATGARFLTSIRDRLGTPAVNGPSLGLCKELFVADAASSQAEDAVLQNLRSLLE
jgi:hypothetical protein